MRYLYMFQTKRDTEEEEESIKQITKQSDDQTKQYKL